MWVYVDNSDLGDIHSTARVGNAAAPTGNRVLQ
jgi:hypothetical protein